MREYTLTDPVVRGVLTCLSDLRRHSLDEIVTEYNQKYPPSWLLPVPKNQNAIKQILTFLVREKYVSVEVMSFYEEAMPAKKMYALTNAGIQHLSGRRR
jgi:DNA-binding PadR family transcriptional regulator